MTVWGAVLFTNQNPLPEQKRQGNARRVFPCSFVGVLMKKIKIFICIGMIAMLLLVMESGFNEEPIQYIDEYSFFYPYENVKFADKKTVQVLMEAYEKVDFFSEFQKGNLEEAGNCWMMSCMWGLKEASRSASISS